MDPAYAERYRDLYRGHWWWRGREAFVLSTLRRWTPPGGFGRILDVGCGDGLLFDELRRFGEPEGIEVDRSIVTSEGRAKGSIHVCEFDAFRPGHRYGLLLMLDVVEHMENDRAALRRAFDHLRPGGLLVLTVPALLWLWTRHDDLNHHRTRYRRRGLTAVLRRAGFAPREVRYFFHWLVPLKLAVRLKERLVSTAPRPPEIPGRRANAAFLRLCLLEQRLTRRLAPPLGSSLLAVAQAVP